MWGACFVLKKVKTCVSVLRPVSKDTRAQHETKDNAERLRALLRDSSGGGHWLCLCNRALAIGVAGVSACGHGRRRNRSPRLEGERLDLSK